MSITISPKSLAPDKEAQLRFASFHLYISREVSVKMEEQKEKMDDLASLFLPDLLHPLSTFNQDALVKQEDDGFHAALFQTDEPKMSS